MDTGFDVGRIRGLSTPEVEPLGQRDRWDLPKIEYARGVGSVYDYPRATVSLDEKRSLLTLLGFTEVVPLKTVAAIVGWDHYLFVMPQEGIDYVKPRKRGSQRGYYWKHRHVGGKLTADVIRRSFAAASIECSGDLTPYVGPEALPPWASYGTVSPLVPLDAFDQPLLYGSLQGIFLPHSSLTGKCVEVPFGGAGERSRRKGLHVQFDDLATMLGTTFSGRVHSLL